MYPTIPRIAQIAQWKKIPLIVNRWHACYGIVNAVVMGNQTGYN